MFFFFCLFHCNRFSFRPYSRCSQVQPSRQYSLLLYVFLPLSHTFTHSSASCDEARAPAYKYLPPASYQGKSAEICSLPPCLPCMQPYFSWMRARGGCACAFCFSNALISEAASGFQLTSQRNACVIRNVETSLVSRHSTVIQVWKRFRQVFCKHVR